MKLLLPLLFMFETIHCSHFRGGILTWKHLSGNEVRVTHRMSWRNTHYTPVCDDSYKANKTERTFGTFSCISGCGSSWSSPSIQSVCTDYSTSEDWATYEGEFKVTLQSSTSPLVISYTSCCWIGTLIINPSSSYTITTRIDLSYRQDIAGINSSPVTAMQPIVRLQHGCSHSIKIPVADDNGDIIRCRWAQNTSECGGICNSFPGAVLNQTDCRLDYSSESHTVGYYGVAIQIEDFANSSSFTPLSSIPLQFLVVIFNSSSTCSSAPTFISPTPSIGECFDAIQGVLFSIDIRINSSQQIKEVTTQSPVGLTKSSVKTLSSTEYSVILTWTPTISLQGTYIVCFTGVNSLGLTTESRCITLNVVLFTIVLGSQQPSGIVYGDNRQWSLQYSNSFIRPSTSTYIRIYESNGLLVESIDATSSSVVYPNSTSGRKLTFLSSYNFEKGRAYYILFDEGVVNREFGCTVESPAIVNTTFWTFTLYNDECASDPCHNNGTCVNEVNLFSCVCDIGHYGSVCEFHVLDILDFGSSSAIVREGKPVEIQLLIRSKTTFEFRWFHNEFLITNFSTRYKITNPKRENATSILTMHIERTLQRDQGEWKITVSTGEVSESRHLTIIVIPRLLLQMTPRYDFSVQLGDTLEVQCTVHNPDSLFDVINGSVVFKKDGFILLSNNTFLSSIWSKSDAAEEDSGRYTCLHSGYPDTALASLYVTVIKPDQKRCESEYLNSILWSTIRANSLKREPCPANYEGIATRFCNPDGVWESPDLLNCTTAAFMNASTDLDSIIEDGIRNPEKIQETVTNTLQMMINWTSSTSEISPGDLSSLTDILEKIVNVTNSTETTIDEEVFFSVVDAILSSNNSKAWSAVSEKTDKDASSLLRNMDRLCEVVIQNNNITATQFTGSNFNLTINKTKLDETGIRFPAVTFNNVSVGTEELTTFLELPKQSKGAKNDINYVAVIYKSMAEILPSDFDSADSTGKTPKRKAFINSHVLSLTTQTDLKVLNPSLKLTFRHIKIDSPDMQATCVSWNFTNSKWTETGCKLTLHDHKRTECQCNHLTNFAILMRPYTPTVEDKPALKTMSLIGVILSITFTVLTFTIYTLTWRFIKSEQNIMMLNLCASLVVAYVIFISAVEKTEHEGLCIAITAILHYLFLVTFFNMLGIGIHYFMSITVTYYAMYVANNFKSKSRVHWFLIGVWGIPLPITLTCMGVFWGKGYHLKFYCWLSTESGSLYMFIIPVCLIALMNLLIIVSLVKILCATSVMAKSSLQKKAASGLRSLGTLLPVLGVTWLFGILAVNEKTNVFQYLFVIANSLQGFFIFVSHVLLNKKVMLGLRNKYPVLKSLVNLEESSQSGSSSISRTQSSRPKMPSLKSFERYFARKRPKNNKVEKSDSFLTEKTMSTECSTNDSNEKSVADIPPESKKLEVIVEEDSPKRRFRFSFNFIGWMKKYTVTEM
ncbi:uncharacterized protein LOC111112680 [Crassostrea virginica]